MKWEEMAVVGRSVGQALDVADGVIGRVADRAAAEARQSRNVWSAVAGELLFEKSQGIGVVELFRRRSRSFFMSTAASGVSQRTSPSS